MKQQTTCSQWCCSALTTLLLAGLLGVAACGEDKAPATCTDESLNGDETDLNCGGSCTPCADTLMCALGDDCNSGVCASGVCQTATCADDVQNGNETDLNCGGSCDSCDDGLMCAIAADCESEVCTDDVCQVPSCTDDVQNSDETDLNCGGSCDPCVDGLMCAIGADCESAVCAGEICQVPSCTDTAQNGDETDLNCGGSCDPCVDGLMCAIGGDCESAVCTDEVCQVPSCTDNVQNGTETDLNCGGSCAPCADDLNCVFSTDCQSEVCESDVCMAPSCTDGLQNGDEFGVDCGPSCTTLACTACLGAPELIRNGGFEELPLSGPINGQGLLPRDWVHHNLSADTYSTDSSFGLGPGDFGHFPGVAAQAGLRWVATSVPETFKQLLASPLDAGVYYVASAYIHRNNGSLPAPATFKISLIDDIDAAELVDAASFLPFVSGDDWEFREFSFVAPATAGGGNFTGVFLTAEEQAATGYPGIDSFSLKRASDCP